MPYGIKSDNKMPPGRKPFAASDSVGTPARSEIIRPHAFGDGQPAMGTPDRSADKYPSAQKHNMALRGERYGESSNPTTHSKNTRRYGRNPTTGDVQGSTGEQPASQERRELPGSIYARAVNPAAPMKTETLGYFDRPTVPNTGRTTGGDTARTQFIPTQRTEAALDDKDRGELK